MIGKLRGIVDRLQGSRVLLDVNGVGYTVTCSGYTLKELIAGEEAVLLIETHVREDAINLFGFKNEEEQNWFKLLTTVQGVGAKVALSLLSALSPETMAAVIVSQDKSALTAAEGVGPKLALRLVTELKDKVLSLSAALPTAASQDTKDALLLSANASDAVSALVNLGYRRHAAFHAINQIVRISKNAKLDELIRLGLAELGKKENAA